jgi:hypothetical protein
VEAALAVASLVTVLVLAVGALAAMVTQVRCVDSAREAARLAARGDDRGAVDAAARLGPDGSVLQVHRDGGFVIAHVSARAPLLPGLVLDAEAVAAVEPGQ